MTTKPTNLGRVRELQQRGFTLSAAVGTKPAFGPEGMKLFLEFHERAQEFSRASIKDREGFFTALGNLASVAKAVALRARTAADPDERKLFQLMADEFRSFSKLLQASIPNK